MRTPTWKSDIGDVTTAIRKYCNYHLPSGAESATVLNVKKIRGSEPCWVADVEYSYGYQNGEKMTTIQQEEFPCDSEIFMYSSRRNEMNSKKLIKSAKKYVIAYNNHGDTGYVGPGITEGDVGKDVEKAMQFDTYNEAEEEMELLEPEWCPLHIEEIEVPVQSSRKPIKSSSQAEIEGYNCGHKGGGDLDDNPYDKDTQNEQWDDWRRGYSEGDEDRIHSSRRNEMNSKKSIKSSVGTYNYDFFYDNLKDNSAFEEYRVRFDDDAGEDNIHSKDNAISLKMVRPDGKVYTEPRGNYLQFWYGGWRFDVGNKYGYKMKYSEIENATITGNKLIIDVEDGTHLEFGLDGTISNSKKSLKSSMDYDRFNWDPLMKDGDINDDLIDQCIRVVEWYNGEDSRYDEDFDRFYEVKILKGYDKKDARKRATESALVNLCGDVSSFRAALDAYCNAKGTDNVSDAIIFANYPPEETDERNPQEKWEDYVYSKDIKSSLDTIKVTFDNGDVITTDYNADVGREEIAKYYYGNWFNVGDENEMHKVVKVEFPGAENINSNKEPADMDMAYQLEGYIESDGDLYRQMIVPVIKNLERKVQKGIYDYDKSLIAWQHVADEGARRYVKELGGPAYNVATRKEVAKKLSEYYEENYMGDNPISSSRITSSNEDKADENGPHMKFKTLDPDYEFELREQIEDELEILLNKLKVNFTTDVWEETVQYILSFFKEDNFYNPKNAKQAVHEWYLETKEYFPEMFDTKKQKLASARYIRWLVSKTCI